MTFAVLAILNRKYLRGHSPLAMAGGQNAVAALLLLPWFGAGIGQISLRDWLLLAVLGIFCTACAHALFIRGLATVRAQVASVLASLEPVYGIVLALLVLGEVPPGRALIGGLLILGATGLASFRASTEGDASGPQQPSS